MLWILKVAEVLVHVIVLRYLGLLQVVGVNEHVVSSTILLGIINMSHLIKALNLL